MSIGPLETNFSEILIKIQKFSFTTMHLKISCVKWRSFFPGGYEISSPEDIWAYVGVVSDEFCKLGSLLRQGLRLSPSHYLTPVPDATTHGRFDKLTDKYSCGRKKRLTLFHGSNTSNFLWCSLGKRLHCQTRGPCIDIPVQSGADEY